jgi:hypothetical protein
MLILLINDYHRGFEVVLFWGGEMWFLGMRFIGSLHVNLKVCDRHHRWFIIQRLR